MTQDQRYDMITEMYEATRYAKEIHKKAEKEKNKAQAYKDIMNNSDSERVLNKIARKGSRAEKDYDLYNERDTIAGAKDLNEGYKKHGSKYITNSVRDDLSCRAKRQPGRYQQPKERKPGTYLNAQRTKRGE